MCQYQYGCFFVSSCFVLVPCVRYGYNSLKKVLLLCYCVARDTHFSAFILTCSYTEFFFSSQSVTIHGVEYRPESVIRVTCDGPDNFNYATIKEILLIEDQKIFVIEKLVIDKINIHLCSLEVNKTSKYTAVPFNSFYCHGVLHFKNNTHLIEKDNGYRNLWCYLV